MSTEYYNLDAIVTNLKKEKEKFTAFAEAWEKVTFPVKKDGTPFQSMQKNIDGAKYTMESYAMQPGEYELTVYTHSATCGYIHDSIKVYNLVKYLKDPSMLAKTQNYMPEQSYLEQVYKYDIDDIKQAVAERAAYCRAYVADLDSMIKQASEIFRTFRYNFYKAMEQLKADTKQFNHSNLYYAVKDCIVNRYPYV